MKKRSLLIWLPLFGVASLLGYFDALGSYASAYHDGVAYLRWDAALAWDLTKWNLWVLFAPFILLLGRRFPVDRFNWIRHIPFYVLTSVGIALLHLALLILIRFVMLRGTLAGLSFFFKDKYYVLMADFLIGIMVCGFILAAGQALAFYRQVRAGELKAAQLETQLAQAQLQALKMQLHPHFIFNALHSISSHLKDTETARLMIARLGDFLRLTLANAGAQEVSLKQELEFLRCYLDIEQTRFRERLTVDMQIDPETWDAMLPNLILQPIVENAIKHGIAPQRTPGRISVRSQRLNGSLRVEIEDNGCGLPETQAPAAGSRNGDRFNEGIGLGTTRSRLERFYPDSHLLQMRNAQQGGLVVTLEVPFRTEANGPGK